MEESAGAEEKVKSSRGEGKSAREASAAKENGNNPVVSVGNAGGGGAADVLFFFRIYPHRADFHYNGLSSCYGGRCAAGTAGVHGGGGGVGGLEDLLQFPVGGGGTGVAADAPAGLEELKGIHANNSFL